MTIITYSNKSMFLPSRRTAQMATPFNYAVCATEYTYRLDNVDDVSPEIIFNMSSEAVPVSVNQEFQLWYGQDLGDCSEVNNHGQSCVYVYFWYNSIDWKDTDISLSFV